MPRAGRRRLAYAENALAYLESLPPKQRRQVTEKIDRLTSDPRPPGCRLVRGSGGGEEEVYRIRSGDYRALYVVRGEVIVVLDVGHRKDIYRRR